MSSPNWDSKDRSARLIEGTKARLASPRAGTSALKPFKIYVKCICKIRQTYEW